MILIKIPEKIPTLNHLYWHRGNMKILKTEARKLRERIIGSCLSISLPEARDKLVNKKLSVYLQVHEDWLTKKGEVKKKDLLNREKFLIDSVFEGLGLDDKFIFKYVSRKIQSEQEYSTILIEVLNE